MKVMSKKLGESISVGEDVVVTLLSVRGGTIRVGVKAPLDVPIEHGPSSTDEVTTGQPEPSGIAVDGDEVVA